MKSTDDGALRTERRREGSGGTAVGPIVDLLVDLATRYYVTGQTQVEIARSLGLDPSTVSRYLKRARDEGIVRVEIQRPRSLQGDLAQELAEGFHLKRAVVVAGESGAGTLSWIANSERDECPIRGVRKPLVASLQT